MALFYVCPTDDQNPHYPDDCSVFARANTPKKAAELWDNGLGLAKPSPQPPVLRYFPAGAAGGAGAASPARTAFRIGLIVFRYA